MKKLMLLPAILLLQAQAAFAVDWRDADRSSMGFAPAPLTETRAVVQVYAARVLQWRKYFAVHSWIAVKAANADHYVTYQVIGWRLRWGQSVVVTTETQTPDARWFGNEPSLLYDLRGSAAARAISSIEAAVASYPYPDSYQAWPGPNSNTFVSHLIRNTPELRLSLPPHAIGKDWIENGKLAGLTESKTGVQLSLFGLLGIAVGLREGIELNILGLNFGVDLLRPAVKLPMIGRLGVDPQVVIKPEQTGPPCFGRRAETGVEHECVAHDPPHRSPETKRALN